MNFVPFPGTLSTSTAYGYNACRAPWRIAMDYCFNGEARANREV